MADLASRATKLYNSLNQFKPTDSIGENIAVMYDAVLAEAKEQLPDDPILKNLKPVARSAIGRPVGTAGDLLAVIDQILDVLGEGGPAIA